MEVYSFNWGGLLIELSVYQNYQVVIWVEMFALLISIDFILISLGSRSCSG